ncbi:MAG: HflC protein [Candidatus Omnitrophica bacterium CG11_big_fil_rev_8_21_14_0_20_42_13]|uniref:Protein HflC n=1 Tax=Candidatus Ghiorseimicrobium undicola TaxID=1974746 RepID=A0A2H0LVK3_9BACT|nr:MAG: HflC protein [Candidatus Omnitrophica bacterium CG11_big_fil_rev_8_21_14_0_20_42_13]
MKFFSAVLLVSLVFILLVLFSGVVYVVDETKQVVITQFGEPVGSPISNAGLYFKIPFIQQANYFEKRLLEWDGDPNQIPTRDKKYIWVDTYARWNISDPLKFLQSVGNEIGAHARLDDIINSATRDTITAHLLVDAVRNTNRVLELEQLEKDLSVADEALERIDVGREELEKFILEKARQLAPQYGIELVDVRIKRVNYVDDVRRKVYERMIAERKRAAEQYRSEGNGKSAEIEGQLGKELKQITSEAYRKAEVLRGEADAQVIKIYADAYSKDPELYSFTKTLKTYEDTIDDKSTVILTTNSDYYKYLRGLSPEK